ncbi:hypothetical protein AgCh_028795 [Apium graveolens]
MRTSLTPSSNNGEESARETELSTDTDESSEPKHFRLLSEIYDETEEVEVENELPLLGIDEPLNYTEVVGEKEWEMVMKNEIKAIEKNRTWKLVELPPDSKSIGLKWVFKLKWDVNRNITKHKARLVSKGYVQKKGVDFEEVFTPVTRLETVRLLLALAARNGWEVHYLDVKSAFMNGELEETVYLSQPEGFVVEGKTHLVYQLIKAFYGLRQAPRTWYTKLSEFLERLGFEKCPCEHAVYTGRDGGEVLVIAVYVNDILVTGTHFSNIKKFKCQMGKEFEMTDLGKLYYYLGIEVMQSSEGIILKQAGYASKLLEKFGMNDCNAVKYSMEVKVQIDKDERGKPINSTTYKSLIGGLRYVKGTMDYGLNYSRGADNYMLSGFSDSDMAGNTEDRRSTGGMVFYLNESLINWVS